MKFIDNKTDGGRIKGKIALYCRVLDVSRQGFYNYLQSKNKPYKGKSHCIAECSMSADKASIIICNQRTSHISMQR